MVCGLAGYCIVRICGVLVIWLSFFEKVKKIFFELDNNRNK